MGIYINPEGSAARRDAAGTADGILILDKPAGLTSHDVVARVRRILHTRRVGHTGTLDPFATGVLVICLNRATRLAQFLSGDEKEYLATIKFGYGTDTGDLTGRALGPAVEARHLSPQLLAAALEHFRGCIRQVPPMYSAKKIGGERLYEIARRGHQIERRPIEVEIKEIELSVPRYSSRHGEASCFRDQADGTRDFSLRVVCSAGTYIRTLAEDLGRRLGIGAHLTELRRTRAGTCEINRAVTLERLTELAEAGALSQVLLPMAEALRMPALRVSEAEQRQIAHGRAIKRPGTWRQGERIKLCGQDDDLIAIAEYDTQAEAWRPRVVFT
jgi:tRNA pseudouridine55 synthase